MVTAQSMAHMNCVVYLLSSVNHEYEKCPPNSFFFLSLEGSRPECCYFWALPLGKEKKVAKENVSFFFFLDIFARFFSGSKVLTSDSH